MYCPALTMVHNSCVPLFMDLCEENCFFLSISVDYILCKLVHIFKSHLPVSLFSQPPTWSLSFLTLWSDPLLILLFKETGKVPMTKSKALLLQNDSCNVLCKMYCCDDYSLVCYNLSTLICHWFLLSNVRFWLFPIFCDWMLNICQMMILDRFFQM